MPSTRVCAFVMGDLRGCMHMCLLLKESELFSKKKERKAMLLVRKYNWYYLLKTTRRASNIPLSPLFLYSARHVRSFTEFLAGEFVDITVCRFSFFFCCVTLLQKLETFSLGSLKKIRRNGQPWKKCGTMSG